MVGGGLIASAGQVGIIPRDLRRREPASHLIGYLPSLGRVEWPGVHDDAGPQYNSVKTMSAARHLVALLKSHVEGDERRFYAVAMQAAAHEARQGHTKIAQELRSLIDEAKSRSGAIELKGAIPLVQPKGELSSLLSVGYPEERLSAMVLPAETAGRLKRVLREQKQQDRLLAHGLPPRRKLLLLGPPGSGKTMTAAALAGELKLPLFTIRLEGVITKFMGETAAKLRLVFDAMSQTRGVYFFDEFDTIGARRSAANDVGEIRRVLNSFLQFLDQDLSRSLVLAATNHPELLDPALFRRFDDVIEYALPDSDIALGLLQDRLALFETGGVDWKAVVEAGTDLSQAELVRAAEEAAKSAVLGRTKKVTTELLVEALAERKLANR